MKLKKICITLLACMMLVSGPGMCAAAAESGEISTLTIERASGRFSMEIPGETLLAADKSFSLESGEEVTINASYSPRSASLDFGLIDSDGIFHYLTVSNGSINKTIGIEKRGSYTLAVRNNSSQTVSVSGFVEY